MTSSHLERAAIVYVRQSTLVQVREHTESTLRQYDLAAQAARLGWTAASIEVIDADLGLSGRTASHRDGFKQLVARVCMGEVGAVFGLEVSRLARSNADLARLLELARLTSTLVIDSDGVYELSDINDRLLLGMKSQMSEAELHWLTSRMNEAKRAAARRGELHVPLPVGLVYDDDGNTVIDPDEEVAAAIADVFAAFTATGSAYAVTTAFAGRRFPRRAYGGVWAGQLRWGRLTHSRAVQILHNPGYAGAYVYGRRRSRQAVTPDGLVRTEITWVAPGQWEVVIPGHHPGYITWEAYQANQDKLTANRTSAGARPPREGTALCQGIVYCGGCGQGMQVRHQGGHPRYQCTESHRNHAVTPQCGSVRAGTIDAAVADALLAAVAPGQVELALAAAGEVTARHQRSLRAAELAAERARYAASRAERTFLACEPENRLVARTLETRWETALADATEAEAALAARAHARPELPSPGYLAATIADLPALWSAPTTSSKDRKRLLRTLLADVTITPSSSDRTQLLVGLHWKSGASQRHASVARVMPELLGLFPGEVTDSWRAKRTLPPARLGITPAARPVPIRAVVFVHVDPGYRELVDEPGDTLVHRLNPYENAVRYIRGGSTPWLAGGRFGPYVPPVDDPAAHAGRTATLERLLDRSRYIAGPPAAVAEHISALVTGGTPVTALAGRSIQ